MATTMIKIDAAEVCNRICEKNKELFFEMIVNLSREKIDSATYFNLMNNICMEHISHLPKLGHVQITNNIITYVFETFEKSVKQMILNESNIKGSVN